MRFSGTIILFTCVTAVLAQHTRATWHDPARQFVKEVYQVKDTIRNIRHGSYVSYFINGKVESRGNFVNNQSTGLWEFFYESGNIKMRGHLQNSTNAGLWEFFYENGVKSMEGVMNGPVREGKWNYYYEDGALKETGTYLAGKRHGLWRWFYEDGVLKAEGEFEEDYGLVTEYYHSGKILAHGPKMGSRKVGTWRYYNEADGTLLSEGNYTDGKKNGEWTTYYPSGQVASRGSYRQGEPEGTWNYYHPNGRLSSTGSFSGGLKDGYWVSFSEDGKKLSEIEFSLDSGFYKEYYPSGKLRVSGKLAHAMREGEWLFYREDGTLEGRCEYRHNRGRYNGFYSNGALQTRGDMEGDKKTGTWEIYDPYGRLTGYYKPYYDESALGAAIAKLSTHSTRNTPPVRRGFSYFIERTNEFKGIILSGNPMLVFAGRLPVAVEFYNQERLGHEFEFTGLRDPFFVADRSITTDKPFERGYSMAIRQKFYNPKKAAMWYFAHELRFINMGHFINKEVAANNVITFSASEQRIQYGLLTGYRLMQRNNKKGFSLDVFLGCDFGYRNFDVSPQSEPFFAAVRQKPFVVTGQGGFHVGYVFQAQ